LSETERVFTPREVLRLLRLTPRRAAQLRRLGLLLLDDAARYRFRDLVAARVGAALLEAGARVRDVRAALDGARRLAPDRDVPLAELRFRVDDGRVVVEHDRLRYDPRTGQGLLDLPAAALERETRESLDWGLVRPLQPPAHAAEAWFERAAGLEGDPEHWEEAVAAYERVVAVDPDYAAAWNNLGLLEHRMGRYERAGERYRRALETDPACCQAAFNLGALQEDLGDLGSSVIWYRRALELDPDYADAHFNLAGVLGKSARPADAAVHWRRYLALDQGSPWADIARSHLQVIAGGEANPALAVPDGDDDA